MLRRVRPATPLYLQSIGLGALMRFPIRPGKVTCAGIVIIFMVMPNSIWKGPDAKVAPAPKPKIEAAEKDRGSVGRRVKFRKVNRDQLSRATGTPLRH